jgi:hypothetical protein
MSVYMSYPRPESTCPDTSILFIPATFVVARLSSPRQLIDLGSLHCRFIKNKDREEEHMHQVEQSPRLGLRHPWHESGNQLSTPTSDPFRPHHLCNTEISNLVAVDALMLSLDGSAGNIFKYKLAHRSWIVIRMRIPRSVIQLRDYWRNS